MLNYVRLVQEQYLIIYELKIIRAAERRAPWSYVHMADITEEAGAIVSFWEDLKI